MTLDEFIEECRNKDGWQLLPSRVGYRMLRNRRGHCPLEAVFGPGEGYVSRAMKALDPSTQAWQVIGAADNMPNLPDSWLLSHKPLSPLQKKLLTLVKS